MIPIQKVHQLYVQRNRYYDIDEINSMNAQKGWEMEVSQLKSGKFCHDELVISADDYHFQFFGRNLSTLCRGQFIGTGFQFCIPLIKTSAPHHINYITEDPTVSFIRVNQEVNVIIPGGFYAAILVIDNKRFHELLECYTDDTDENFYLTSIENDNIFFPSMQQYRCLRENLIKIYRQFLPYDPTVRDYPLENRLIDTTEQIIVPQFLEILAKASGHPIQLRPVRFIEALQVIFDNLDSPPTIQQLSLDVGTTPRNLQYLFKQHLGINPKQFMNIMRLNRARHLICTSRYKRGTITDIANQLGFWHMGNFSQEFKRLFLKSPSEISSNTADDSDYS